MYVYLILWILICILGFLFGYVKKTNVLFLMISFLAMALVLGLRGTRVGEDTLMYMQIAESSSNLSLVEILKQFPKSTWSLDIHGYENKVETVYLIYNKVLMSIVNNPRVVLLVTALITCSGFAIFIYKNSKDIFFSTYIFMCEGLFMFAFNGMRQMLAMSIAINSYTCIKNKRYKHAILLIFLAALFHQSAIIYLFLFLLPKIKKRKKTVKYVVIGVVILSQSIPIIVMILEKISPYYSTYFKVNYWQASASGIIILWLIELVIITIIYLKNIYDFDKFSIVVCSIIYIVLELVGLKFVAISRVALYFRPFILLLFPTFKYYLTKKDSMLYIILLCTLVGILFFKMAGSDVRLYSF